MPVYPTSDVSNGSWTDQSGGTSLFAVLDETTRSDADYVKSSENPVNDTFEVALGNPSGVYDTLKFAIGKETNNSVRIDITVALMQGATQIAPWTYTDVAFGFDLKTETLTAPQLAAITDDTDLRLRVSANAPTADTFSTIFGADLVGWWDVSAAGTVTHSSGAVSSFVDLVSGIDLVQATSGNKPTYSATGLGGAQPAITFDGADDYLATSATAVAAGSVSEFCAFFVGRWTQAGTDSDGRLMTFRANGAGADSNNAGSAILFLRNGAGGQLSSYRINRMGTKATAENTTVRLSTVWEAGDNTFYVNNVAGTTVADGSGALAATGALSVGGNFGAEFAEMVLCEMAFVKRAPTVGELAAVESMLAAKWTA